MFWVFKRNSKIRLCIIYKIIVSPNRIWIRLQKRRQPPPPKTGVYQIPLGTISEDDIFPFWLPYLVFFIQHSSTAKVGQNSLTEIPVLCTLGLGWISVSCSLLCVVCFNYLSAIFYFFWSMLPTASSVASTPPTSVVSIRHYYILHYSTSNRF